MIKLKKDLVKAYPISRAVTRAVEVNRELSLDCASDRWVLYLENADLEFACIRNAALSDPSVWVNWARDWNEYV